MSLARKAVDAFKWSALSEIASRSASALLLLVLARLLAPDDFGVVAAATVVISLSQVFADAGLDKALIQRRDHVDASANIVFWLNVAFGALVALILVAAAPAIGSFFHDPRIVDVVRILALQVPLASIALVHAAILKRDLRFKELFWVRLLTTTSGAIVSLPLAFLGMGYWALIFGTLLGQGAQAAVLWWRAAWRPAWRNDAGIARELIAFGRWAMLSGLLGWFYTWVDAMVVGHYLGARDLGLYRTGNALVGMAFGLIFSPALPVLYSLFVRAQADTAMLRSALQSVSRAISLVALPLAALLFAVSDRFSEVVFGGGWEGIGTVIAVLAVMHGVSWTVGANGEVYRAMGKPHVETWTTAAMLGVYLVGYLVSVRYGLDAFLIARLALAVIAWFVHVGVARIVLGVPVLSWFRAGILLTSIAAAAAARALSAHVDDTVIVLVLGSTIVALMSITAIAVFERSFLLGLVARLRPREDA